MTEDRLLKLKDFIGRVGVVSSTWRKWSQEGRAPQSQKKGRCRFWRESDINAYIAGKWKPTQRENQTKPASFGGAR